LTPQNRSPYHLLPFSLERQRTTIRRFLVIAPLFALAGCATDAARKAELDDVREQMRQMRASQERLEHRLDRVEAGAAAPRRPVDSTPASSPGRSVPELTVIKLKPRTDAAPRIDTSVPVVEPAADEVQSVARPSDRAEAAETPDADPLQSDAEFEQGIQALRTGNVQGGVTRLLNFASHNPRHPKADNALYFAGMGLIGLDEFETAAKTFERLLAEHPAGDAIQDAMMRLAECRTKLNQMEDAKVLYARVVSSFPGTAAASQAEQRLASLK